MHSVILARLHRPFLARLLASRFARNWSFLAVSSLACQALGMLATIRIARVLSPDGYGQYNLVQTVAGLAAVVAGLGLRNVVMRETARHPHLSGKFFLASLVIRAGTVAVAAFGILAYERASHESLPGPLVAVAIGLLAGQIVWDSVENIAFGHERMEFSALINLVGSAIWLAIAWATPAAWLTPLSVSAAFTINGWVVSEAPIAALAVASTIARAATSTRSDRDNASLVRLVIG